MAWAAGFFDGEGSIGIERRSGRSGGRLVLTVVQKHRAPLDRLQDIFETGVVDWQRGSGPRGTPRWRYRTWQNKALAALIGMRPYLLVKAEEADIAIEYQLAQAQGRATPVSTTEGARAALSAIKHREGVKPVVPVEEAA